MKRISLTQGQFALIDDADFESLNRFKWQARICQNDKLIYLGYFDNEIEAAKAYDRKAIELFGDFAYLNFERKKAG